MLCCSLLSSRVKSARDSVVVLLLLLLLWCCNFFIVGCCCCCWPPPPPPKLPLGSPRKPPLRPPPPLLVPLALRGRGACANRAILAAAAVSSLVSWAWGLGWRAALQSLARISLPLSFRLPWSTCVTRDKALWLVAGLLENRVVLVFLSPGVALRRPRI